jgi:LemA protein
VPATSILATPELINNPQAFQQWQAAQGELSQALSRLMVVVERYPELKSISGFDDLRAQLEGTENRIAVARKRYIDAVQTYNVTVRSFPTNLTAKVFGHDPKQNFSVENEREIARPPAVDFGRTESGPQQQTPPAPPAPQPQIEKPG